MEPCAYSIQRHTKGGHSHCCSCISVSTLENVDVRDQFLELFRLYCTVLCWVVDYFVEGIFAKSFVLWMAGIFWRPEYYAVGTRACMPLFAHLQIVPGCFHGVRIFSSPEHTYLVQVSPWSARRWAQAEAFPLHSGWADACDSPKCGLLGHVIFKCGGLRSR